RASRGRFRFSRRAVHHPRRRPHLAAAESLGPQFEPGLDGRPDKAGTSSKSGSQANASAPVRASFNSVVGDLIAGRSEVEELVGSGGMSSVYRAHERLLERTVA